jgi:hypothetical protein
MTQPKLAVQKGRDRYYEDPLSGLTLPSVTTVGKSFRAWGLETWKVKMTAQRAVENIARLDEMSSWDEQEAIKWLISASSDYASEAGDAGDRVHEALEHYAYGEPFEVEPEWEKSVMDFLDTCDPEFLFAELSVFNPSIGYAGSLDAICELTVPTDRISGEEERGVYLVDYKTTKSVYPFELGMQLAALAHGSYGLDEEDQPVELPSLDGAVIVHFKRDEGAELYLFNDLDAPFQAFYGLLKAFNGEKECRQWMKRVR